MGILSSAPGVQRSGLLRPIALLLSGTALAQAVPVLLSPVFSRLYSPSDYGAMAWALSVVTVASLLATGTYEHALNLPRDRSDALALGVGALGGGVLVTLGLLAAGAVELAWTARWSHRLWFAPVATLLTVTFNVACAWANREARFALLARARIALALATSAVTLACGWRGLGELGLMLGTTAGLVVAVAVVGSAVLAQDRAPLGALRWPAVRAALRAHDRFPRWQLPASLIDTLAMQVPVWFLGRLFGPAVLGQFALLNRVLNVPGALLGSSVGEVFRQRAAEEYRTRGECARTFAVFGRGLTLAAIPPALVLLAAGPEVFAFVFGDAWRPAGEFARIMAVLFALRLIVAPLTYVIFLAEQQRLNLVVHLLFLAGALLAWAWGHQSQSAQQALAVYVGAHTVVYLWYARICRRGARGAR